MKEAWKQIEGYEGLYEVSNLGRVKSLPKPKSLNRRKGELIMSHGIGAGYPFIILCKNGKVKNIRIHRLVAKAFIPNLDNKPQVNHINCVKHDNKVENLEWTTQQENITHAIANGIFPIRECNRKFQRKKQGSKMKVAQVDRNLKIVRVWKTQANIAKFMGVTRQAVSLWCKASDRFFKNSRWVTAEPQMVMKNW